MRVTIWDLDFFNRLSFKPNITVMKISSYHKQQEHIINFVNDFEDIKYDFDLMYIVREHERTPFPPSYLLDHKNVKLVGPEFKIYPNHFDVSMLIAMVRPDYGIYNLPKDNIYSSSNMLQFLHGIERLPAKQDAGNIQSGRTLNIVADKTL